MVKHGRPHLRSERTPLDFRSVVEAMPDGFALHEIILDAEGRPCDSKFLDVNLSFERLTGLKKEVVVGRRALEVIPGLESYWIESFGRVALSGESTRFENFSASLNRWYGVYAFRSAPGQFAVIFSDITEPKREAEALIRTQTELKIRETKTAAELRDALRALQLEMAERAVVEKAALAERQRFYDVLETLPAYLILLDADYRVPFANRFFRERFGESRGRRCYDYLFHRSDPCPNCETYKVMKTRAPHRWEWTGPDGRNYDIYDFPFKDTDDSPLIMEMGIDITERKKAEEELRIERDRLQTLLDSMSEEVWAVDTMGNLVLANGAALAEARKLGADPVEIGRPISEVLSRIRVLTAGDGSGIADHIARLLSGETIRDIGIAVGNKKTGEIYYRQASATPVKDRAKKITGAVGLIRDVTENKRLEEELKKREEYLRRASRMEALGTLAGGIAHDFNNLLSTIVINSEMALLDLDEKSQAHHYLPLILQAASRGRELVDQIITFSRHKERALKPVSVHPILKEALVFVRSTLARNVELREEIATESDVVLGDPAQIHQVLMNLCKNAAEAMADGGGDLEVRLSAIEVDQGLASLHPDLRPGKYVRLTVRDTGHGMPPEVRERIFDPFFTTKGPGKGSGMGLAVVHGIVKALGGATVVDSEVGRGSMFDVFIPRIDVGPEAENTASGIVSKGKERILLIEDEETQLRSMTRMLRRLGYQVTAYTGGYEALDDFQQNPTGFDLVITDQAMPRLTGIQLADRMLMLRPDLPIILCTGYADEVDEKGALDTGIRELLKKPFGLADISAVIRRILERGPN